MPHRYLELAYLLPLPEAEYKKAVDDFLNSGKLTTTTYVNGREFNRPTAKDDIEAVFIAEYAKSPRTAEQPWSQK